MRRCSSRSTPCSSNCRPCRSSWRRPRNSCSGRATAGSTAQQQASTAQQPVQNIPPNLYNADLPIPTKGPPAWFDTIHVSLAGSFIAAEGVFRERNEISSGASDPAFGTIPLQNSPLWSENELRMSAQQSRIALKVDRRHRSGAALERLLRNGLSRRRRRPRIRAKATAITCAFAKPTLATTNDNWGTSTSAPVRCGAC